MARADLWLLAIAMAACSSGQPSSLAPPPPAPGLAPPPVEARDAGDVGMSCEEAKPLHDEQERASVQAFKAAARTHGVSPVTLTSEWIPYSPKEPRPTAVTGTTLRRKGKDVLVIQGPTYDSAGTDGAPPLELVSAPDGRVWYVRRDVHVTSRRAVKVDACQWGCFDRPHGGDEPAPELGHWIWFLQPGQHFEGELVLSIDLPAIDFVPTRTDCPEPA